MNSAKDSNTRLAVIGGGSWGTTLASLVSRNAQVTLWARDAGVVREINDTHTHARYLEGLSLNFLKSRSHGNAEADAPGTLQLDSLPSPSLSQASQANH